MRGRDPSTDHLKALLLSQQSLNKAQSSRTASLTVKPALQKQSSSKEKTHNEKKEVAIKEIKQVEEKKEPQARRQSEPSVKNQEPAKTQQKQ